MAEAAQRAQRADGCVGEPRAVLQVERAQRGDARDGRAPRVRHARRVLQAQLRQEAHARPAAKALACARAGSTDPVNV